MYSLELILYVTSGAFISWLTGLGAGLTVRFVRNIITSATSN